MGLAQGTRLGNYEVLGKLGEGGMGEVYRARDTQLDRDVAIKILPEAFATDPDRLARFEREAKTLASLNHPNIAHVYGLEASGATRAIVMELVDGPTVQDMLAGVRPAAGGLPIEEAVAIARQIAEALEAAHEAGVIHRDLKPANIKVRDDGTVKVLDFGLAKALQPPVAGPSFSSAEPHDLANSPTVTSPAMTALGMILGTAAYMAPEQAKGKPVDKRADIWAFGCVLYEMLVGRRAFDGEDVSDTLALVLRGDIDWHALPADTPAAVRRMLRRCLERDPKRRIRDIGDALLDVDETAQDAGLQPIRQRHELPAKRTAALLTVAAAIGAVLAAITTWSVTRPTTPRPVSLSVVAPAQQAPSVNGNQPDFGVFRDGSHIVYTAGSEGQTELIVRPLDRFEGRVLDGVGSFPRAPFVSPDGRWIGFMTGSPAGTDAMLRRVSASGGPPLDICPLNGNLRGASWDGDDTIVFATAGPGGLFRVRASGGEPEALTTPDGANGEADHRWPHVLPQDKRVLFGITRGASGTSDIALLSPDTGRWRVLIEGGTYPRYVSTGHIVYGYAGTLRAVGFDLDRGEVTGDPIPVVDDVLVKGTGAANFDVAENGTLVAMPGSWGPSTRANLAWMTRDGREEVLPFEPGDYQSPRISPDGTHVVLLRSGAESNPRGDVLVGDLTRGTLTPLTFDGQSSEAQWTADGTRVVFFSRSERSVVRMSADGGTPDVLYTLQPAESISLTPTALSQERVVVSQTFGSGGGFSDIAVVDTLNRTLSGLVVTRFTEAGGALSPDGRWLAYQTDESGRFEVFVQPFPTAGGRRIQISTAGGSNPVWGSDGRALFFRSGAGRVGRLAVVPVDTSNPTLSPGLATPAFEPLEVESRSVRSWDLAPDGQRLLFVKPIASDDAPAQLNVVLNWTEALRQQLASLR